MTVESQPPGPESAASDPTVAYDAVHGVWLVGTLTIESNASHVYVARSTDGLHWSAPVTVASGPELDKDWIACDNNAASPYRGRCYAEFSDDAKNMTVSESSDDGGLTWSAPVKAYTILVGTQPVILPNGTLVVVAGDYAGEDALTGSIASLRSTDGGGDVHARERLDAARRAQRRDALGLAAVRRRRLGRHDLRRVARLPLPPGLHGERHGRVDVDGRGDVERADPRADRARSPRRSTCSSQGSQPTRRVPAISGSSTRSSRRARARAARCTLEMGFTSSPDGGKTWTAPQRLDAQPMQMSWLAKTASGRMVGDYFSTSFAGGRVVPVFTLADIAARRPLPRGDLRGVATRLADPPARAASRPRRRRSGRTRARRTASRRG